MKKTRALNVFTALLLMLVFAISCNKPDEPNNGGNNGNNGSDVRVTTYSPQEITATTVKCGGDVIAAQGLSLTELGVCWGKEQNPTADQTHLSTSVWNEPFVCTITDLEPDTKYYYRAYALRGLVYYYGEEMNFTTTGGNLPNVMTLEVTDIITNTAKGRGVVTSEGSCPVTERGICWSMNSNPSVDDAHINSGTGMGSFEIIMESLELNTTYYVRAYAKNCNGINYGSEVSFITPPPGGSYNGHDYVDLGLPSGTLWATCNVGADMPENIGDIFAWGETEPKSIYDWSTYKYCMGDRNLLTKYCNNPNYGYNGFTDELVVLQANDDAATVNWGEGWHTPSTDEWYELFSICDWTYTRNGLSVEGWSFIGPNGNSIFIPYNGVIANGYWSNSISSGRPYTANLWKIVDGHQDGCNRCNGCSVRPVHPRD